MYWNNWGHAETFFNPLYIFIEAEPPSMKKIFIDDLSILNLFDDWFKTLNYYTIIYHMKEEWTSRPSMLLPPRNDENFYMDG